MFNPLVSIICSCYNHEQFIKESIQSILDQTYKNIEIIIVDDFSTDNSRETITNFIKDKECITFIKNSKNLGLNKSFNNAFKMAKGEFIVDLSADDVLLEKCIEKQIQYFYKNTNAGIVYGNALHIDENNNELNHLLEFPINTKNKSKKIEYNEVISGEYMNSTGAMIKAKGFSELSCYDENLAFEDYDYWIRTSKSKYDIIYFNEIIVKKRKLKDSLHANFKKKTKIGQKCRNSLLKIYNREIQNDSKKKDLKVFLKRINRQIIENIKLYSIKGIISFTLLKLKTHYYLIFNSKNSS